MQSEIWGIRYKAWDNQPLAISDQQSTYSFHLRVCSCKLVALFLIFYFSLFTSATFAQKTNEAIKQGNEAYRKNDFTTAIKDYTKAVQADGKNAAAKFNLANAQQKTSNAEAAADNYDEAVKATTDADLQAKAYYNKGLAMLEQKKLNDAINAFKQSLRLAPADNDTRENLQKALEERKPPPPPKQQPQQQKQNSKPEPQEKGPKMDKKMMEQKFKMLQEQEKQLQSQLQKQKSNVREQEKDW